MHSERENGQVILIIKETHILTWALEDAEMCELQLQVLRMRSLCRGSFHFPFCMQLCHTKHQSLVMKLLNIQVLTIKKL